MRVGFCVLLDQQAIPWAGPRFASTFNGASFWAGLEGVFVAEPQQLLHGISVEPCYGDVFAHPVLAVHPPPAPNAAHPAPWFACRGGGRSIDVRCQLHVPADSEPLFANRVASAWLAAATLRLLLSAPLRLAVLSDTDFATLAHRREAQPTLIGFEQAGSYSLEAALDVTGYMVAWRSLLSAMIVAMRDERFCRAFAYLDAAWWVGSNAAFMVSIWTALEALLLEADTVGIKRALAERISELLASSRSERDKLFNKVLALYRARCDSAHEALHPDPAPLQASVGLAGAVFFAKAGAAIGERW